MSDIFFFEPWLAPSSFDDDERFDSLSVGTLTPPRRDENRTDDRTWNVCSASSMMMISSWIVKQDFLKEVRSVNHSTRLEHNEVNSSIRSFSRFDSISERTFCLPFERFPISSEHDLYESYDFHVSHHQEVVRDILDTLPCCACRTTRTNRSDTFDVSVSCPKRYQSRTHFFSSISRKPEFSVEHRYPKYP